MWTVVRFELATPDYPTAFALLRGAGFAPHRQPRDGAPEPLPAAVVQDLLQDPAVVTRAVFEALEQARLVPVAVAAAHVDLRPPRRGRAALAPA